MPTVEYSNMLFDFMSHARFRVWRHVLYAMALAPIALSQAFFALGDKDGMSERTIYLFGIGFSITIIAFAYFNRYYLTPRFSLSHSYVAHVSIAFLLLFGIIAAKYFIESLLIGEARRVNGVTVLDWLSNTTLYAVCIASSSISVLFREWVSDHHQIENLETRRLKNDIDEFKNQLNPQLLQDSLAYAAAKTTTDSGNTSEFLSRLSELLRYQLYDFKRQRAVLGAEILFMRNYLALRQEIAPFDFSYTVSHVGNTNLFVVPGLFIPLIDAALDRRPAVLAIHLKTDGQRIAFECAAPGTDLSGCDLKQAEQRLTALGADYELNVTTSSLVLTL
ncbi:histidine kinase [Parapedobacter sp. 10938]|uniref:histidine kinase n=1 Tax=Parapedobacter flavus TaxID=3110225 RepID=UPI002DBA8C53|nr:histidine kinase [Parapedobacter sp. 10938]MEC3878788.1 histidine kinase [Parapedobacter sp. 10938]